MFWVYEMEYTANPVADPGVELIPFRDSFYPQYERIYNECFFDMRKALNIEPYDFYSDISQLQAKKENIFLLVENDIIIGSVGCFGCEIDDLIVNKQYQCRGYGALLLNWAVSHIRELSHEPITLHAAEWNQSAVKLYLRNGFVIKKKERIG